MSACPLFGVRLVRERTVRYSSRKVVSSPSAARAIIDAIAGDAAVENFVAVLLDNASNVLGAHVIAVGGIGTCQVEAAQVFRAAIVAGATTIVIGHNHPSGDVTPSRQDREITARLCDVGAIIGIPILDHVIVTRTGEAWSFMDHGEMPKGGAS